MARKEDTVAFVGGCGRLGLSIACATASMGYDVVCADVNEDAVDKVNAGISPISEPGVEDYLAKFGDQIAATTDSYQAARDASIVFVIVPTPSLSTGKFSIDYILQACEPIGRAIKECDDFKTVVIESTVNPRDTGGPIRRKLEGVSGKKAGVNFGLVYSPEFIRQGSIIEDFLNPDFILLGGGSGDPGVKKTFEFYQSVCGSDTPIDVMSLESAEITKVGLNATVVTKTAMALTLAQICHNTPGANAEQVLDAIGSDRRIGSAYFGAGTPVGGPCFPRDCVALLQYALEIGVVAPLLSAVDRLNKSAISDIVSKALSEIPREKRSIGVLGVTYKPGVDIIEESAGVGIAKSLKKSGRDVVYYDPSMALVRGITRCNSIQQVVEMSKMLIIACPWPDFMELMDMDLRGVVVFDCWGMFNDAELNCEYVVFGDGRRLLE